MSGYTKLFSSIVGSTIWREDPATKVVWITLLVLADRDGIVESSVPGLANYAGVSIGETETALQKFQLPDSYSRSPEHDGRRIESVDGGWLILNHHKYRQKMSKDDIRERDRLRKQRLREQQKELSAKSGTKCDQRENSAESDIPTPAPKAKTNNLGAEDRIGEGAGQTFDPAFDALEGFERLCQVFPKAERGTKTQELYMRRVEGCAATLGLDHGGAADHLLSRASRYASLVKPAYSAGLFRWLNEYIYDQPDSAWDQSVQRPTSHQPSVSDRMRAKRKGGAE